MSQKDPTPEELQAAAEAARRAEQARQEAEARESERQRRIKELTYASTHLGFNIHKKEQKEKGYDD